MRKLCDKGVLLQHPQSKELGMSLYACTLVFDSLLFSEPSDLNPSTIGTESEAPTDENPNYNSNKEYNKNNVYNNKEKQAFQEVIKEVLPKPSKKQTAKPLYPASFTDTLISACNSFFDYRKDIKKPYKNQASMMAKIAQFKAQAEKHGEGFVIFSINETISNGWTGTFADDKMIKNYLASIQTTNNYANEPNNLHPETAKTIDYLKRCIDTFDLDTL